MAATKRVVDLTDVKDGGGSFRPRRKPEGDYRAKIVKVEDHKPKANDSVDGWVYTIQIDGDARSTYPYYVNPAPKQAWKIGRISEAAGFKVAGKRVNFDPNKLVGKVIGVMLVDDEYEGREKSSIDEVFPASEVGNAADADIDTDDQLEDDETVIEDDETYDEGIPEDDEDEPEPEPVKPVRRRKPAPPPEPEPEDDEEYEDDPEPTPPPRKRAARPAAKKATRPVARARTAEPEDTDDDLDELDVDEL